MIAAPYLDAALAVELSMEERRALMTEADWSYMLDRFFFQDPIPDTQEEGK